MPNQTDYELKKSMDDVTRANKALDAAIMEESKGPCRTTYPKIDAAREALKAAEERMNVPLLAASAMHREELNAEERAYQARRQMHVEQKPFLSWKVILILCIIGIVIGYCLYPLFFH